MLRQRFPFRPSGCFVSGCDVALLEQFKNFPHRPCGGKAESLTSRPEPPQIRRCLDLFLSCAAASVPNLLQPHLPALSKRSTGWHPRISKTESEAKRRNPKDHAKQQLPAVTHRQTPPARAAWGGDGDARPAAPPASAAIDGAAWSIIGSGTASGSAKRSMASAVVAPDGSNHPQSAVRTCRS